MCKPEYMGQRSDMPCHSEICRGSQKQFINHKEITYAPDLLIVVIPRYDQYGQNVKNPFDIEETLYVTSTTMSTGINCTCWKMH